MSERTVQSLTVIGAHSASDAYPNTKYAIASLRERFRVREINVPLLGGGGVQKLSLLRALYVAARLVLTPVLLVARGLVAGRIKRAYVPYPAVPLLFAWSWLPSAIRPRLIVADAFISWYDTIVNDRRYLSAESLAARIVLWAERRALSVADVVVVDTLQNAEFYSRIFSLPRGLFAGVPLATNELDFAQVPLREQRSVCNVLFIGTLIPLHGLDTILSAARALVGRADVRFTVVGNGQERDRIESAMTDLPNMEWHSDWKSGAELAALISEADICLGIFGPGDKAQRVCPYKIYAYACMGRPVVTADTRWLRQACVDYGGRPFVAVPPGDPIALADAIGALADDPDARQSLSHSARCFYEARLSNEMAANQLAQIINGVRESA